jgi:hypothetical protein
LGLWGGLGGSCGSLEAHGGSLVLLGALMGSWKLLRGFNAHLGASWGHRGGALGHHRGFGEALGGVLGGGIGGSWRLLGASQKLLGTRHASSAWKDYA